MTSVRILLLLAALSAAPAVRAFTVEPDPEAVRPPYATLSLSAQAEAEDPADDPVVFDPEGREAFPPHVPDILRATFQKRREDWIIIVRTQEPIPDRPRWPLQAGVYIDRADIPNPPSAGLGAGADISCTSRRVKRWEWNTICRYFEPGIGKWQDGGSIETDVTDDKITFRFPLTVLPAQGARVRFSVAALTGAQLRSLDVLPGEGLPAAPVAAEREAVPRSLRASAWAPYALAAAVLLAAGAGFFLLRRE